MSEKQGIRIVSLNLWRRERIGMMFTLIFALYIGGVISLSLNATIGGEEDAAAGSGLIDWIYVTMFPIFGTIMSKSAFGMWRDDHYSKRLAHWRTMPIPIEAIVKARFLQTLYVLPSVGAAFLLLQYGVSEKLREALSPLQLAEFWVVWLGYSVAANALLILWELCYSGKRYTIYYFLCMAASAVACAVIAWQGGFIFIGLLNEIGDGYGWAYMLGSAGLAIVGTWLGYRVTVRKIRKRSLTF
ncbi:ABC-2 transporter permease [Cohnella suwonensis]|uniref:ABC-2 transporter permease n=1 Tax=Cohnella suwonensis TaxID=696072 RepID=A0ABW0LZ82_9BACL